jgi:tRNA A-37 threonylcarbamoyl transferase component Bud32
MQQWHLRHSEAGLATIFGTLDTVFAIKGELITRDKISDVIRIEHSGSRYYIKRYTAGGSGLRRFFGRPRVQGEWENLQHFADWGIPTAPLIAYGLERNGLSFTRGAIVTQEIKNTRDLADMADHGLLNANIVKNMSSQLARFTQKLHQQGFAHNDLKWRNILVDDKQQIYLIDCPLGGFWRGAFFRYRQIKDLKTLDNRANKHLRRSQRMRFFLDYCGTNRLNAEHKKLLRGLLQRKSRRYDKQSNLLSALLDHY